VMSSSSVVFLPLTKVPCALKPMVAPAAGMVVGIAVGFGVAVGVTLGVTDGVGVGDGGAPSATIIDSSAKPGLGDGTAPEPPLLVQLSSIAPNTNSATGETISHLSHHEIDIEGQLSTQRCAVSSY
jgi:hypothetical protein